MKFKEIKIHLYCLEKLNGEFIVSKENLDYLNLIFGLEVVNKIEYLKNKPCNSQELSTVYNYHLHEILFSLKEIDNWILSHSKKKTIL